MGTATVEVGNDYVPKWDQPPVTVIKVDNKRMGVQIESYTGSKRWFSLRTFKISFTHYTDCIACIKGD
jgi:hypothetical protein